MNKIGLLFQKYGTILALIGIVVFFSIMTETFLTSRNLINILSHISMLTIIATGMTVCMIPGDFDMSIASVASLSGVIVTSLILKGLGVFGSILITVGMGALFGVIAGILITRLKISAFIATLALGTIATGINFMFTRGQEFTASSPIPSSRSRRKGSGNPRPGLHNGSSHCRLHLRDGKDEDGKVDVLNRGSVKASFLSGINVRLLRVVGMIISGALAAFTGCILASRLGSGQPTAGDAYLMDAIAASFLGMTTIKVGRPNVPGTFVGALIIGVINNGLVIMGVSYFFQYIAKGAIIILAVSMTSFRSSESF
jgi:ribose/xylose/arabinose/galactoside ABC-type transport system permease subunit